MCAIFGWYNPTFPEGFDRGRLLRHLARKSQMYGDKSFGLFGGYAGSPGGVKLERYTGPASLWIQANAKQVKAFSESNALLGHTRWPTRGAVTKTNCHPFSLGEWVACHNGMISNSTELMVKAKLVPKGETDSEEALVYVAGENFSRESMCQIRGGFAFGAFKNDLSKGLLICDDRQRMSYVKLGDGFVWCTDGQILESSLVAAGIGDTQLEVKRLSGKILDLNTGELQELEVRGEALTTFENEVLESTRNGGRSSSKRGGKVRDFNRDLLGYESSRPVYRTSRPLDLSIGRKKDAEQEKLSAEAQKFKDESQEELDELNDDEPPFVGPGEQLPLQ